MGRWLKRSFVALLVLLLVGAAALAWALRTGDLLEHLIPHAQAAYAPPERPLYVDDPLPDSFAAIATPALADLKRAYENERKLSPEIIGACNEVREGNRPYSELPAPCRAIQTETWPAAQRVLLATHAAKLEFPRGTGGLDARFYQDDAPGMLPYRTTALLAALEIRGRLNAGDAGGVTGVCLDSLALGRDVSHSGGLVPLGFAFGMTRSVLPACAAALHRATPARRDAAVTRILRIRDGWIPFQRIVLDETTFAELRFAGFSVGSAQLERLPAMAAELARQELDQPDWWWRTAAPLFWRKVDQRRPRLLEIMERPVAVRTRALQALAAEERDNSNPITGWLSADFSGWHERYLRGLQMLTLLAAAGASESFRVEQGRWPTLTELVAMVPGLEEKAFVATPQGDRLELALPADPGMDGNRPPPGITLSPP